MGGLNRSQHEIIASWCIVKLLYAQHIWLQCLFSGESLETADSPPVISVKYEWWYFTSGFFSTSWRSSQSAPLKKHASSSQSFFLAGMINKVIKRDFSMIKYLNWMRSKFYWWKVKVLVSVSRVPPGSSKLNSRLFKTFLIPFQMKFNANFVPIPKEVWGENVKSV